MTQIQAYGSAISLAAAKAVVDQAEQAATQNGWAMVIVVIDVAGQPVVLHKMDNASYGAVAVAQAKATTALNFKRSTKSYDDAVTAGGAGLRLLSIPEICPIEGGTHLVHEGKIVGAIGVSGAQPAQDGQVAEAGAAALAG